ncbi:MAG: metallophosphoesterase [Candidatus Sericytochromatia bacterium]|nr:metallophosphoesterase [Candidatus Sericytochromatia bacterium]
MSDSGFGFNLNAGENLSFDKDNKTYEQTQQDVVFQNGKAVTSKVMSSPMFSNTIKQYGVDAAKTIILQELLNMSEPEIIQELNILATIAEDDQNIKRSLRAAKFMAVQWIDDEKRNQDVRNKCQFIVESIPTFKISAKKTEEAIKPKIIQSEKPNIKTPDYGSNDLIASRDDFMKTKPLPPENPVIAPVSKSSNINKLVKGERILIITDIQGDYNRLKDTLVKYKLASVEQNRLRWNKETKTKLVLVGDLFNKSPYSSWGGNIAHQTFLVIEAIRRLISESNNNIFLCLGNYDLQICSGQVFRDSYYGFNSFTYGIKAQAQLLPALMSYIEGTGFDDEQNVYSIWQKELDQENNMFFRLKDGFTISGSPAIKIKANELGLPDINSVRYYLQALYKELTLPIDKRPKNITDLDKKAHEFLRSKPGEDIQDLADSKKRANFFAGILYGSQTIDFLRRFISPTHKFQSDRRENITISHVGLQNDISMMLEKAKEVNWNIDNFEQALNNSKFLKMRKIDTNKFYNDLSKAGFNNINEFLSKNTEELYDELTNNHLINLFIPYISPNKLRFGYTKSFERIQEGIKLEDKSGLLGFRLVNRSSGNDFDDIEMKKVSELNDKAKQAYADKILTDIFGNSKLFTIKVAEENKINCEKPGWKVSIEIDKTAALYEDLNKNIQVPIKHIALISYS